MVLVIACPEKVDDGVDAILIESGKVSLRESGGGVATALMFSR